jgi:hypothetical protein
MRALTTKHAYANNILHIGSKNHQFITGFHSPGKNTRYQLKNAVYSI